jgi:isocitrate/isopropylmalate dehydrogenase
VTSSHTYTIDLIAGDGIGREVTPTSSVSPSLQISQRTSVEEAFA